MRIGRPLPSTWNWSDVKIDASKDMGTYELTNIGTLECGLILNRQVFDIYGRGEALCYFDDPSVLLFFDNQITNLSLFTKHEAQAGNISATKQVLTIKGGSASSTGHSWIYYDFPSTVSRVYVKTQMLVSADAELFVEVCDGSGATFQDPPDLYRVSIIPFGTNDDFRISKVISGSASILSYESVDLLTGYWYTIEAFFDVDNNIQRGWRDGEHKLNASDSDITSIKSIRFRCYDNSTTILQYGQLQGLILVVYE